MTGGLDARLAPAAVGAWIAAWVAVLGVPWWAAALAWAVVAALGAAAVVVERGARRDDGGASARSGGSQRWRGAIATTLLAAAAVALVATSAVARDGARHPAALQEAVAQHRHVALLVTATGVATPSDRFVPARAGDAPVLVFAPFRARVDPGEQLLVEGSVQGAAPGDDISYLVFCDDPALERALPPWWMSWSAGMRASFAAASADLPGDGGALLPGLAIGDDSGVPDDLDQAMKGSSLSHLTAVSGANCAVIIAIALGLARALGLGRRTRVAVALVLLVAFVVLVTPQASVVRAAVMAGILLVGGLGGRGGRGLPVLCLAVVALLALDPWMSRDYGFALSVLATAALVTIAGPLGRALARVMPAALAQLLAIPLAAQLACQPVLVLLQPTVPLLGVVANVLAEPAAPLATVAGLAACALGAVAPHAAVPLDWIAWAPAAWIGAVARFASSVPGAAVPWTQGVPGLLLLGALTLALLVALLAPPARSRPDSSRLRMLRPVAALIVASLVVALGSATIAGRITARLAQPADWEFAACDVGQGDSFVIRSDEAIALIDTGPDPAPLRACLDTLGIAHIDLLVLTHWDADHIGGVSAVMGRVGVALVGPLYPEAERAAEQRDIQQQLAQGGAQVRYGVRGMTGRLGADDWRLLWPPADPDAIEPGNQASLTLLLTCATGCLSGLFLGDLGAEGQSALLAMGAVPHVDVVKVAHHGSADQDPDVYSQARATVGLIGVGIDNDYGHPTQKLLDMLAAVGTTAERTDLDGLVLVSPGPDPGTAAVWTEKHVAAPG